MEKVVLITGTSTGLGINIAVQAAKAGHKVYATMRNLAKRAALDEAAKAAGVEVNVLQLDVQDSDSINVAVDQIIANDGRVDTLINNAGSGFVRSTEQATEDEINAVMDVNFMGVVRCTKAVLPHMRKARAGHVITVSSVGGLVGQPFNEIYCAAKFAVEGYMESLACYVGPAFNIDFSTIQPGGIKTEFANSVMKQVGETGGLLEDEYLSILQQYMTTVQSRSDSSGLYQTPDEVAEVIMSCMNSEKPPVRMRTSEWGEKLCSLKTSNDPDGHKMRSQVSKDFLEKEI